MVAKAIAYVFACCLVGTSAFGQQLDPDSVVSQVFNALTADPVPLPTNTEQLLIGPEWEALAYWEVGTPKQLENLNEAVGDVYQFQPTSFIINLVDPNNPRNYLASVTGSWERKENEITLKASNGKTLQLLLTFIDSNYAVMEVDGLRIFFTQSRSFNTH